MCSNNSNQNKKVQIGLQRRQKRPLIGDLDDPEDTQDDGLEEIEISPGIFHRVQPHVYLSLLPVMLGSRLCRLHNLPNERLIELGEPIYEPGGYFLLRGKERVIIPQKNLGKNTLFITREGDEVTGTLHACLEAVDAPRVVNKLIIGYDKEIHDVITRVHINQIYTPKGMPIGVLLFLLGLNNWNVVIDTISAFASLENATVAKLLRACETETVEAIGQKMTEHEITNTFDAAWAWLADHVSAKQRTRTYEPLPSYPEESKRNAAQEVVHHYVLPHVMDGIPKMQKPEDFWSVCRVKAHTLCHMIAQIIRVYLKIDDPTDRDRMEHKR